MKCGEMRAAPFTNITGGIDSFDNAVLNRFLKTDICEISIFSRDEKIERLASRISDESS